MSLSQEDVLSLLDYDNGSGLFTWKTKQGNRRWNTSCAGKIAGRTDSKGYLQISVNNRQYLAHRLVWLVIYGEWPKKNIDHVNGDKKDNRVENLREVTQAVNAQNLRAARSDNIAGRLGVSLYKRTGKFVARIMLNGKSICIGVFDSSDAAHEAYIRAKRSIHEGCTI